MPVNDGIAQKKAVVTMHSTRTADCLLLTIASRLEATVR